ncbi:MAG: 2,3-bisphosphoglycerate-dependent phosphoglycerate mutase, partial [Gammaproteobacteria bacterium]
MKLILLRHGESKWNLENRFTGWTDVTLTSSGIEEASFSGKQLLKKNIKIVSVYTSLLKRAIETTNIVSEIIKFPKQNIKLDWRLNERHYGALQGLNKSETAAKFGEQQVLLWRRSYDIPPPSLDENDERHPRFDKKFQDIG